MPFAVLAPMMRRWVVRYRGLHMPLGVMVMLAFCTLRNVPTAAALQGWSAAR